MMDSDAPSRVVILLTDGVNNSGEVAPQTAAEIARTYGVRVYTIGVGANGLAPYPVMTPWGVELQKLQVEIDEDLLKSISEATGGRYFRATTKEKLSAIFTEIDQMEKSKISVREFSRREEEYLPFALWAIALLLVHVLLRQTILRNIP